MKSFLILIILGLVKVVFCTQLSNVTEDDSCPVSLFRRKRANVEYTRWRSNMETTPEFIVKVLDDFPMTTDGDSLYKIPNKRVEKIIIGGALVPPSTTATEIVLRDYTRFRPPTTVVGSKEGEDVYESEEVTRHPPFEQDLPRLQNRDESRLSGPQFHSRRPKIKKIHKYPMPDSFVTRAHPHLTTRVVTPTRTKDPAYSDDSLKSSILSFLEDKPIFRKYFEHMNPPTITTLSMDGDEILKPHTTKSPLKSYEDDNLSKIIENTNNKVNNYKDNFSDGDIYKDTEKTGLHVFEDLEQSKDENEIFSTTQNVPDVTTIVKEDNATKSIVSPTKLRGIPVKGSYAKPRERRNPVCNMIKLRQVNFNVPLTLPEIVAQLKQWTEDSPLVQWADITDGNLTSMENPIYVMTVDDPSAGQVASAKQNVLLVAGIQGRDHYAVASAMFVLYQLIERSESHADLLSKYRFWVIPVFNTDGYDYSMTFPNKREWMKNLRQTWDICEGRESCHHCRLQGLRCAVSPCYGVNLDRNFEYQWISPSELKAEHPCGNLYAGARQLSEPETQALSNFLQRQQLNIAVFIAFKEGDILGIMYPYSHTKKKRAFDSTYRQRASRAATAAFSIAGRPYVAGQTSEFLPLYAGGIEDWADGHLGIDNTYTIMMYLASDSNKNNQFAERVIQEAYTAMDSLLLQTAKSFEKQNNMIHGLTRSKSPAPNIAISFLICISTILSQLLIIMTNWT